jgi:ATP-dependent DNA helicase RecQ
VRNTITFFDLEISEFDKCILDLGCINEKNENLHKNSMEEFLIFIRRSDFIAGHNVLNHDLKYLNKSVKYKFLNNKKVIDTLYLSPLLFPEKKQHSLLKDDKILEYEKNNPLNDSIKSKQLLDKEISKFSNLDDRLKQIYYLLLKDEVEFSAFFEFIDYKVNNMDIDYLIRDYFKELVCVNIEYSKIFYDDPIGFCYCISFIDLNKKYSTISPWVLSNYPKVHNYLYLLKSNPCIKRCDYCKSILDINVGLKRFFGFDSYRKYDGESLQEKSVQAAVDNKSILSVFPTGGGKSITFQVPALMAGELNKGLTIVISPLQSLMKDQVDNLERKGITEAVTINGMVDPIERVKAYERVEEGSANILYISPESLRTRSIETLLLNRRIERFVIDEAHCFSSWGQDFRPDYLYIGKFIKLIIEKKNLNNKIPISCFTATAKKQVIEDICNYFKEALDIDLELFVSKSSRTNLVYKVIQKENDQDKYNILRDLIKEKKCPTIIYVSRTRKAVKIADRLSSDGFKAKAYHGKMDLKEKIHNQETFINGKVDIIVATSAFGMGVDKKDVGLVIHFEISDSLENYVQEAGRAGRDEKITAECFVLFNDDDLNKHFMLLNQTRINMSEIKDIWRTIKKLTPFRMSFTISVLELARRAGWDDDNFSEIETRVRTAITALENSGYLERNQNAPRIFANSILSKSAMEANKIIRNSKLFDDKEKEQAVRIMGSLFSSKSLKFINNNEAESRIDYLSDRLGIDKRDVVRIIGNLRELKILADTKDLTAFIKRKDNVKSPLRILKRYKDVERFLFEVFDEEEKVFHIKTLNFEAETKEIKNINPTRLKTIINFWKIKNWISKKYENSSNNFAVKFNYKKEDLSWKFKMMEELSEFIIEYLYKKNEENLIYNLSEIDEKEELLVEFSVHEIKNKFIDEKKINITIKDIEDTLFYLSKIDALKIEGGFLVIYNGLRIKRLIKNNKINYKVEDYVKLKEFYSSKIQQIHIVGEYAKKMLSNYDGAIQFVEDYFHMEFKKFLNKYFDKERQSEISRNISPLKFQQLFGSLSNRQLQIINDKTTKYITVAAGPGSGKTKVLVHKIASLYLMEEIKHEQFLMLTFSRAASTEFKKRLKELIGNAANFIEINTFHSYCFDLLGQVGSIEKSENIVKEAVKKIRENQIEINKITKKVLVIDEAQDMDKNEFELISLLMEINEDMRVIAVGDDDQNIYEFRGSNSKYMNNIAKKEDGTLYELIENYRSARNIVYFTNEFLKKLENRIKVSSIKPIKEELGSVKIVNHKSKCLIIPIVDEIIKSENDSTNCILTWNNNEAMHIVGLLLKNNKNAKLIQSNDSFNLYNLKEIRYFLDILELNKDNGYINNEKWNKAKLIWAKKYKNSPNFDLCKKIIVYFEEAYTIYKYGSDLEIFIRESKMEDFFSEKDKTIFVSTIHKTKGKEFDNVYLMLNDKRSLTEEAKRCLYVAMTRAKKNLIIHYNENFLDKINFNWIKREYDNYGYKIPNRLSKHLIMRDVVLDFFISRQSKIKNLNSGDNLIADDMYCMNKFGDRIIKFSEKFKKELENINNKNFKCVSARVNFIIYWKKRNEENEFLVLLPELIFERD